MATSTAAAPQAADEELGIMSFRMSRRLRERLLADARASGVPHTIRIREILMRHYAETPTRRKRGRKGSENERQRT